MSRTVRPPAPKPEDRGPSLRPATLAAVMAVTRLDVDPDLAGVARFTTTSSVTAETRGQFAWNLWWMKRALLELTSSPFHTGRSIIRTGSRWVATLSPFNGWCRFPCGGPVAGDDLQHPGRLLVRAERPGAFLLAPPLGASQRERSCRLSVYTFSSYHFAHALGHLNLVACEWLPFFALTFWRTLEVVGGRAESWPDCSSR